MSETLTDFRKTGDELKRMLGSFSAEELNAAPANGGWTAGQVGDHIRKSITGVPDVLKGPADITDRPFDEKAAYIKSIFLDFTLKLQSPDFIVPTNEPLDKEELMTSLSETWDEMSECADTLDLSRICQGFELPKSGPLTRFELLYFCMVHTQRHIHQLKGLKK